MVQVRVGGWILLSDRSSLMSQPPPSAAGSEEQPGTPRRRWCSPVTWFRDWRPRAQPRSAGWDTPELSRRDGGQNAVQTTPQEGLHPEAQDPGPVTPSVPSSPEELIKMQRHHAQPSRPEKTGKGDPVPPKVKQAVDWLAALACSPAEDKAIALAILRNLEQFHDDAVEEMVNADTSERSQLAAWAVDADRLMLARRFLEGIEL